MTLLSTPTIGLFVQVLFQLDGENIWWPGYIDHIYTTGSSKRNTVKVYGDIIYKATKTKSAEYNEERGKVLFKTDNLLHILDANENTEAETTWRYNFIVPVENDYKVHYYNLSGQSCKVNTEQDSSLDNEQVTGNDVTSRGKELEIAQNGRGSIEHTGNTINNTAVLQAEAFIQLQERVLKLEAMLNWSNKENVREVWLNRLELCKYILRKKTLDIMQRPFLATRPKKQTSFSNIYQEHTIRISIACDYLQFKFLLQDVISKYSLNNQVYLYPAYLNSTQPNCATGPLHIVFKQLKDLANYINITSDVDLLQMQFRRSKGNDSSAVSILGSSINDHDDNGQGIDFFVGSSSSSFGQDCDPTLSTLEATTVYRLDNKAWDTVNNRFEHNFNKLTLRPTINLTDSVPIDSNKYFQLIWTHQPVPHRSTWSADSTFTGNIILGQLTLVLPTAEFYGRHTTSTIRFQL